VSGVWCLVSGVWCLVSGVWCLVSGVLCLVSAVQMEPARPEAVRTYSTVSCLMLATFLRSLLPDFRCRQFFPLLCAVCSTSFRFSLLALDQQRVLSLNSTLSGRQKSSEKFSDSILTLKKFFGKWSAKPPAPPKTEADKVYTVYWMLSAVSSAVCCLLCALLSAVLLSAVLLSTVLLFCLSAVRPQ
jgi:hypothetical protein